ncbi:SLAC1 anion channel family protein [Sphingomonas sp. AR_OL41]|uniref:SLAC1 anion channel family protein n=1 Tax=Sphingomonas sp. AR_OL41 TaxID=3042729 RepID=UPI0024814AC1|nr:SLAC1 anion channel family protein [Sphingomonas sp. AR_OL41]MDH7972850.1 SLAC1 anion channel family protein [Sphingomonas sp. AR_OL41]
MVTRDEPIGAFACLPAGAATAERAERRRPLDYLPVGLFASVMGLAGLSAAWGLASRAFGAPLWISTVLALAAMAAFAILAIAYLTKSVMAFDAVVAEFRHPVAGNLFGTIFISPLLLAVVFAPIAPVPAEVMWTIGAVAMLGFAWLIIDRWMGARQHPAHATPAWIVPVVGVLDVPLAYRSLVVAPPPGLMIACLAIGLFFAVPLFTIIFSRLLFEQPLPGAQQPALLILVAPFAVGFSAYVAVTGRVDSFAQALYALAIFVLAVLLGRLRHLLRCCPFRVAWWAVSFPLAACASAAVRFALDKPGVVTNGIALLLLALSSCVIAGLFVRTVHGLLMGELRALSG